MTNYLIENVGQVEDHVTTKDGKTTKLPMGQSLIGEFDEDALKRMRHSDGLRVTRRNPDPKPKADDEGAATVEPAAPVAEPAKPAKSGIQAAEKA